MGCRRKRSKARLFRVVRVAVCIAACACSFGEKEGSDVSLGNTCVIPKKQYDPTCVLTAITSYPGSGNTLARQLIEALTGIWTGSIYGDPSLLKAGFTGENTQQNVVAVKTHGPWAGQATTDADRAIVLMRNPISSIPSWYNWLYGHSHGNQHGLQAPETEWNKYRQHNFDEQLNMWLGHLRFWAKRITPSTGLIVPFEALVADASGPREAAKIRKFLNRSGAGNAPVACLWGLVVHKTSAGIHRSHKYEPKLLPAQYERLGNEMRTIAAEFEKRGERATAEALLGYASSADKSRP
jgi:hypothetical protein